MSVRICRKKRKQPLKPMLQSMRDYLAQAEQDSSIVEADIETLGAQTLGVPGGAVIAKTWTRMNLNIVNAQEVQSELESFLTLFEITELAGILAE